MLEPSESSEPQMQSGSQMQPTDGGNVPIDVLEESNSESNENEEERQTDAEDKEEGGDNLVQEEVLDPFQTKSRKRAKCWNELETPVVLPSGERRTKCKHCGTSLSAKKNGPTSHLTRHLGRCPQRKANMLRQSKLNFLPIDPSAEACINVDHSVLHDGKLDMQRMREAAAHWTLMHEHPFSILEEEGFNLMMKRANPEWRIISRQTGKVDCLKVYDQEKKKLKALLGKIDKVCLTIDLWQSKPQKIEYMVITGHFVDSNCKLQKRVLNFFHLPPPRRGPDLASAILKCLQEWGIENKVFTISVDNATANDTCIRSLKDVFSRTNRLACGVASEATFSAGGRVIDSYRASLSPHTVQVLLCAADWCRILHGVKKKSKVNKEESIEEVILPIP